jgi:hypothetical protein
MGSAMRRFRVETGMPDIAVAVPLMITSMPGPIAMLRRRRRYDLYRTRRRRPDPNDNLCPCGE